MIFTEKNKTEITAVLENPEYEVSGPVDEKKPESRKMGVFRENSVF